MWRRPSVVQAIVLDEILDDHLIVPSDGHELQPGVVEGRIDVRLAPDAPRRDFPPILLEQPRGQVQLHPEHFVPGNGLLTDHHHATDRQINQMANGFSCLQVEDPEIVDQVASFEASMNSHEDRPCWGKGRVLDRE